MTCHCATEADGGQEYGLFSTPGNMAKSVLSNDRLVVVVDGDVVTHFVLD